MDVVTIRPQVEHLFRRGPRRTIGAAVEQELFALAFFSGGTVHPDRIRDAVAGRPYARWVSFEPGGQVELSLPRAADPTAAAADLVAVTRALAADLMPRGVVLDSRPVRSRSLTAPRYLHTPRYEAMEAHFDTIGPAGRRMMRSTTSTQVCLDWWPGQAGLEQWRVLLLAAPFLAAATCSSFGDDGRLTTWLHADPDRTAFDGRLLTGDDPVTAYADFAAGAKVFVDGGVEDHLSTLFPPVRPRGRYLEIRFPDSRPTEQAGQLIDGLAGLLYDDERRRLALASLSAEQGRLAEHWAATAAGAGDVERGLSLLGCSRAVEVAA